VAIQDDTLVFENERNFLLRLILMKLYSTGFHSPLRNGFEKRKTTDMFDQSDVTSEVTVSLTCRTAVSVAEKNRYWLLHPTNDAIISKRIRLVYFHYIIVYRVLLCRATESSLASCCNRSSI
jgi:hypothetical protein